MLSLENVTCVPLASHRNIGFVASHIPTEYVPKIGQSKLHPSNSIWLKVSWNCGHSSSLPSHPDQEKCVKLPSKAKVDEEGCNSTFTMDGKNRSTVWNTPEPKRVKINTRVYEPILSAMNPTKGGAKKIVNGNTAYINAMCSTEIPISFMCIVK